MESGCAKGVEPCDKFLDPLVVIEAPPPPDLAANIVSVGITKLPRDFRPFATEVIEFVAHENAICASVSSDMLRPMRAVWVAVE